MQACGWGVPKYVYQEDRTTAFDFFRKWEANDQQLARDPASAPEGAEKQTMKYWWTYFNLTSIDGLPGVQTAHTSEKVPFTTRPHRFRAPAKWTGESELEEQAPGLVRREARFLLGLVVGVVVALACTHMSALFIN